MIEHRDILARLTVAIAELQDLQREIEEILDPEPRLPDAEPEPALPFEETCEEAA